MIIIEQRKKVIKLLVEFVGACGGKVAINLDEIIFYMRERVVRSNLSKCKTEELKAVSAEREI